MTDVFARLVLGHLAGDYLLQSVPMAKNKSVKTREGLYWSLFHCAVYTAAVCLFLWTINPWIVGLIFLSHWPIDRYSLTTKWLDFIDGRNILDAHNSKDEYREIDTSFACIVYTVADNAMHLILMWGIMKFF